MFHRDRFDGSPKGRAMRRWVVVVALACLALAACGEEPVMGSNVADPTTSTSSALDTPTFDRAAAEAEIRSQYDKYIKATTDITTKDHVEQKTFMKGLVTDEVNKEDIIPGQDKFKKDNVIKKGYASHKMTFIDIKPNLASFRDCLDQSGVEVVKADTGQFVESADLHKQALIRTYEYENYKWLLSETKIDNSGKACK